MSSLILDSVSFFLSFSSDISQFQEQNDLKGLLENLHQNIQAKKRKNVEIMWLAATVSTVLSDLTHYHLPSGPASIMGVTSVRATALLVTRYHPPLSRKLGVFSVVGSSVSRLEHKLEEDDSMRKNFGFFLKS